MRLNFDTRNYAGHCAEISAQAAEAKAFGHAPMDMSMVTWISSSLARNAKLAAAPLLTLKWVVGKHYPIFNQLRYRGQERSK